MSALIDNIIYRHSYNLVRRNILELIYIHTGIKRTKKETDQHYMNRVLEQFSVEELSQLIRGADIFIA